MHIYSTYNKNMKEMIKLIHGIKNSDNEGYATLIKSYNEGYALIKEIF